METLNNLHQDCISIIRSGESITFVEITVLVVTGSGDVIGSLFESIVGCATIDMYRQTYAEMDNTLNQKSFAVSLQRDLYYGE